MNITFKRLHAAVNLKRPHNGFITRPWIVKGWTGQPEYTFKR